MKYTYEQNLEEIRRTNSRDHGLWDLTVLSLLREAPMHPYEMRRVLQERHKDEILVLKPGSLYHAINRLRRARLIEVTEVSRAGGRPERTTYRITDQGLKEFFKQLRVLIAAPKQSPSEAMASVSFLVQLTPEESVGLLEQRAALLTNEIAQMADVLRLVTPRAGRINLLETEYALALRGAELDWLKGVIDDIKTGRLSWNIEEILRTLRSIRSNNKTSEES